MCHVHARRPLGTLEAPPGLCVDAAAYADMACTRAECSMACEHAPCGMTGAPEDAGMACERAPCGMTGAPKDAMADALLARERERKHAVAPIAAVELPYLGKWLPTLDWHRPKVHGTRRYVEGGRGVP